MHSRHSNLYSDFKTLKIAYDRVIFFESGPSKCLWLAERRRRKHPLM
jgi:hypothetical protein